MPIKVVPKESEQIKKYKSRAGAIRYGSAIAAKKQFYSNPVYKEYQQPRAASIIEPAPWSKKA
tara:strand:+ start:1064 stop:1252 length:189 start_codon:yes stop_codon:yes gene_type:complete